MNFWYHCTGQPMYTWKNTIKCFTQKDMIHWLDRRSRILLEVWVLHRCLWRDPLRWIHRQHLLQLLTNITHAWSTSSYNRLHKVKNSPILNYEYWARSRSRFLGNQPAGDIVINPVVGCRYFPPGLQLLSQPKSITPLGLYQIILLGDRGTQV